MSQQQQPASAVQVSPQLHATLVELCTGQLPAYLVGVRENGLACLAEALIRVHNAAPLPAHLQESYDRLSPAATYYDSSSNRPRPISAATYRALDAVLLRFELHHLRDHLAFFPVQDNDRTDRRHRPCKFGLDPDDVEVTAYNGDTHRVKASRFLLTVVPRYSYNSQPVCLHHCADAQTFGRIDKLKGDGTWLLDAANFNRLLSALGGEGVDTDDIYTFAGFAAANLLGGGPRPHRRIYEPLYYCAPSVEFAAAEPFPADELKIDAAIQALLQKPDWKRKALDDAIAAKWKNEAVEQSGFSASMADYMVAKMRWMAATSVRQGVEHTGIPGVFVSESLIDDEAASELKTKVKAYALSIPERRRDYHPRSDDQVWNLVHPSLHPLHGYTPVLPASLSSCADREGITNLASIAGKLLKEVRGEKGDDAPEASLKPPYPPTFEGLEATLAPLPRAQKDKGIRYQWLPAEVRVGTTGDATFLSYINGLSPFDEGTRALYAPLAKAFASLLPLFESVLASFPLRGDLAFLSPTGTPFAEQPEDDGNRSPYFAFFKPSLEEVRANLTAEEIAEFPDYDWVENEEDKKDMVAEEKFNDEKEFVRPPVAPFEAPVLRQVELGGRTLQVIVKVSTIVLTPDKPSYEGGSWHLEGTAGEHICATGIHYLESENVTDASLSFRMAVDHETMLMRPEQNEYDHLLELYGIQNDESATNQPLGAATTRAGSSIAFPNCLQHRLSGFDLVDPSRNGHRTIVLFWLIDPANPTISTARVIPQQVEWLKQATKGVWTDQQSRLSKLPHELIDRIFDTLDAQVRAEETTRDEEDTKADDAPVSASASSASYLLSHEGALQHRLKLMDERTAATAEDNEERFELPYSFCEH